MYALKKGRYGQPGGANLYPVEFCQRLPDQVVNDDIVYPYAACLEKPWPENVDRACHGAEQGYVFGQHHDTDVFGNAVSEAYGHFFRDGVIPASKDWSLNNLHGT